MGRSAPSVPTGVSEPTVNRVFSRSRRDTIREVLRNRWMEPLCLCAAYCSYVGISTCLRLSVGGWTIPPHNPSLPPSGFMGWSLASLEINSRRHRADAGRSRELRWELCGRFPSAALRCHPDWLTAKSKTKTLILKMPGGCSSDQNKGCGRPFRVVGFSGALIHV